MFNFNHPSKYKKTNINVDKQMPSKGDLSEKNILLKLASETAAEYLNKKLPENNLWDFKASQQVLESGKVIDKIKATKKSKKK